MRLLGIDYGSKRIGLALSDESGTMAFPFKVLENSGGVLSEILEICKKEDVEGIVIGESNDFKGGPNIIMEDIKQLKKDLEGADIKIFLEPEYLTSVEAERIQGKNKMHDASAAAIILNSFISKKKNDRN